MSSFFKEKSQDTQKIGKYGPFKGKKLTETVSGKDLMADLPDKDFKTTDLKILENPKEYVKRVENTVCEQNGNISKEKT